VLRTSFSLTSSSYSKPDSLHRAAIKRLVSSFSFEMMLASPF
jgi:hypothetical protein